MQEDPGGMDKGKAKNKTSDVKTIPAKKKRKIKETKVWIKFRSRPSNVRNVGVILSLDLGKAVPDIEQ